MSEPTATGYAPVNGLQLYWERRGSGGTPAVVVHGGFGLADMLGEVLDALAERREVIAVELQGHGHTRDVDRPFSYEAFGDDLAAFARWLGRGPVDLVGYSLGAGSSLRAAVQHPDLVRKLVLVSIPFRRDGWLEEVRAGMDQVGRAQFDQMSQSLMYAAWRSVAPDPDAFPTLMDKTGALLRRPFDWSEDVRGLEAETMLVYGDADSIPVFHMAEFFALLGGGLRDAGWDGSERGRARLAVLPGLTHYDIFGSPMLATVVDGFLGL